MKIYESIHALVTQQRIKKAAATLNESEASIKKAVDIIMPDMLKALHSKGATPAVRETIELAGKHNIINKLDSIYEGSGVIDGMNLGERFENAIIGSQNQSFPESVAHRAGISHESADRLGNWVAATIAAWFGDMTVNKNNSLGSLLQELGNEKSEPAKAVPHKAAAQPARPAPAPKKKSMAWLWWLIIILVAALLAFFIFRSCDTSREKNMVMSEIEQLEDRFDANRRKHETEKAGRKARRAAEKAAREAKLEADKKELARDIDKIGEELKLDTENAIAHTEMKEITLPNGTKITVRRGGCEDQMITYLNSAEYKNATNNNFRDRWFHFDRIDFEFNSADRLTPGSQAQLDHLALILKAYPDAKIKIGGYADKTGTQLVNEVISEKRAEYIKSQFVKNGINSSRISTEGFGEEFATHPENAPDVERALDRHIALRFNK